MRLDLSKKDSCPFQKATAFDKRLKLFLWGEYGTFKTPLALQFPNPAVIDLEGGTDHYRNQFNFDLLKATAPDDIMEAVDWLLVNPHPYRTLVIDPVTIYWDALQRKWADIFLKRKKGGAGYKIDFYELQPNDWRYIKGELNTLLRKLVALDMNIIVTARQKTRYKEGAFMEAIGETFDGDKSLPYMFDTIVHTFLGDDEEPMGKCLRDRTRTLSKEPFKLAYTFFEKLFGEDALTREAKPITFATKEEKAKITEYIEKLGLSEEKVKQRLATYGATTLDDLTEDNAKLIIEKLEKALKKENDNA